MFQCACHERRAAMRATCNNDKEAFLVKRCAPLAVICVLFGSWAGTENEWKGNKNWRCDTNTERFSAVVFVASNVHSVRHCWMRLFRCQKRSARKKSFPKDKNTISHIVNFVFVFFSFKKTTTATVTVDALDRLTNKRHKKQMNKSCNK